MAHRSPQTGVGRRGWRVRFVDCADVFTGTEFLPEARRRLDFVEQIRLPSVTLRESVENANWFGGELVRNIPEIKSVVPQNRAFGSRQRLDGRAPNSTFGCCSNRWTSGVRV